MKIVQNNIQIPQFIRSTISHVGTIIAIFHLHKRNGKVLNGIQPPGVFYPIVMDVQHKIVELIGVSMT